MDARLIELPPTATERLAAEQSRTASAITVLAAEHRISNYLAMAALLEPGPRRDSWIDLAEKELS